MTTGAARRWEADPIDVRAAAHDAVTRALTRLATPTPPLGSRAWLAASWPTRVTMLAAGAGLHGLLFPTQEALSAALWLESVTRELGVSAAVTGPSHAGLEAARGRPTATCPHPGCATVVAVPRCVHHR